MATGLKTEKICPLPSVLRLPSSVLSPHSSPFPCSLLRPKIKMDNKKAVWLNMARKHRNPDPHQDHERHQTLHGVH